MSELPMRGVSTRSVHAGAAEAVPGEAVVTPIHQSTTFHSAPEGAGEVLYSRYGNNPNHRVLERRLCALEGAEECHLFGSGTGAMAAAVLSCVAAGDHVLAARELYGGTRTLLGSELSRLGVETEFVDFGEEGWQRCIRPTTRLLLLEIPANPLLHLVDPTTLVNAARRAGAAVVVDATFATPVNFRPLEHGVDLVVHSATKYLGGHTDVTGGVVCGNSDRMKVVRERARAWGSMLDPHAAWLLERGLKTLALRMQRHSDNGLRVARWCAARPEIERVHYPGLPSHRDHAAASRLLDGFGGMLGVRLRGGGAAAAAFIGALKLIRVAPSLGGVESLVSEPRYTSHASLSAAEREEMGIGDGFVRFSLGIEDAEDLLADIEQALAAVRSAGVGGDAPAAARAGG